MQNIVLIINCPNTQILYDGDLLVYGIKALWDQVCICSCVYIPRSCNILSHIWASVTLTANEIKVLWTDTSSVPILISS